MQEIKVAESKKILDKKKLKDEKDTYKMPFTSLTINNINRFAVEE